MKLALSALLAVLALSQTAEAGKKVVVTDAKAATAEKSRPLLDNKPTGGTVSSGAVVAPASKNVSSPYPPAIYFNF
jgi:hypothetical protein